MSTVRRGTRHHPFATLHLTNGQVVSHVRAEHRHRGSLDFLRQIDKQTPPELDSQLVVDNVTRKLARVKAWLARRSPTSTRLNQVERWLALINQQIELFVQR
jgi:putative transposase